MIIPWKEIIIVAIIAILGYLGYQKVYTLGYTAAEVIYKKELSDYNEKLLSRVQNIENSSNQLISISIENREAASKEFKTILGATKGKPLYVMNSGTCTLSPDFAKAYSDAINRANKK